MTESKLAPLTLDGWFILHQFFQVDPHAHPDGAGHPDGPGGKLAEVFRQWEDLGDGGWSGLYRIVGGGADYMAVHFRSTLEELAGVESHLRRGIGGVYLTPSDDYVSVVELGLYALTAALLEKARSDGVEFGSEGWSSMVDQLLAEEAEKRYVQARLRPRQPDDMPYVCFYPMDKRRAPEQNWYTLPLDERAGLMVDHGQTGRSYAGRVSQIISGSIGFDDWEWGVTLFAADPLDFKRLVTDMRYDPVSAIYAEFGSFWVGYRIPTARITDEFAGHGEG